MDKQKKDFLKRGSLNLIRQKSAHQGGARTLHRLNKKMNNSGHTYSSVPRSIFCKNAYKGQEEIVGFALIIIIVAIVLLVFLSISLKSDNKEIVESYEIESFIQATLQHTSECIRSDGAEFLNVQKLILGCNDEDLCSDDKSNCEILNKTLNEIMDSSWKFGQTRPIKGRKIEIISDGKDILYLEQGIKTGNIKGAVQEFYRSGNEIVINFEVYY